MVNTTKPDVIIATETWLDDSVSSSAELESDAYTIHRRDRKTGRHGGVMNTMNSSKTSTEVSTKSESEILWVKIQCVGHSDIYQGCPKCGSRAESALWLILLGSLHGLDICDV